MWDLSFLGGWASKAEYRASGVARPLCFDVSARLRQNRGFPESTREVGHPFHRGM